MAEQPLEITDDTFDSKVLQSDIPVLVDFWAEWCGPCRSIAPVVTELATEYAGRVLVAKMDVDRSSVIPGKYGIRSIPTLMLFKQGEAAGTLVGAVSKAQLVAFINEKTGE